MTSTSSSVSELDTDSERLFASSTGGLPIDLPPPVPAPVRSTGTVDDDDEPEDEDGRENEPPVRETSEDTELPEELEGGDEQPV
jgi:hypothetical protein